MRPTDDPAGAEAAREVPEVAREVLLNHLRAVAGGPIDGPRLETCIERAFSRIWIFSAATPSGLKRFVVKKTVHDPQNYAHTRTENQATIEYGILEDLTRKFADVEGCSVPRPVALIPERETYIMEFVEGRLLEDELGSAKRFSIGSGFDLLLRRYSNCGRWLRHFQESTGITAEDGAGLDSVVGRCEYRLRQIDELRSPRWNHGWGGRILGLIEEERRKLERRKVLFSGRHGDFGPWNILVSGPAVTVIDFMGYGRDPASFDLTKMLINFVDDSKNLSFSPGKVQRLREAFLEGYGMLPDLQTPSLKICEALHRICSIWTCLSVEEKRLHRRIERLRRLKNHFAWLSGRELGRSALTYVGG